MENAEQWRSLCIIGLVSVGFIQVFCHVYPEIFSNGRNDMAEGLDCDGYLDGGAYRKTARFISISDMVDQKDA